MFFINSARKIECSYQFVSLNRKHLLYIMNDKFQPQKAYQMSYLQCDI